MDDRTSDRRFDLGEMVQWISQSRGYRKIKLGPVVAVVTAGTRPNRDAFPDLYKNAGCGWERDHDSYVVKVRNRHYWPRVVHLMRAEE